MERLVCVILGYVIGSFQTAFFYGKLHGIDIRQHGSGNAGTTNTLRVLGKRAGVIVLLGDMLKCVLAVCISRLIYGGSHREMMYLLVIYTVLGVVLGHDFPFYINFKGGKGVACTAGAVFCVHWYYIPPCALLFFGLFFTTHMVSLCSLSAYTLFFFLTIVFGQLGLFGMPQAFLIEMYIIVAFLTGLTYYQHRANIVRLVKGEENKIYLGKKAK